MRALILRLIPTGILCFLALATATQAQSDPAKIYKTNCALCHSADGSADSPTGKALHAKDLRSMAHGTCAISAGHRPNLL